MMTQWIHRGTVICNTAVRKMLVCNDQWQIYDTRINTYILAVTKDLFNQWKTIVPEIGNIFSSFEENEEVKVFVSKSNYLISSLSKGPFPENTSQLEAFALAFRNASKEYNLEDSLYIEEYSMLLPVHFDSSYFDNNLAFGKWITGGVEVSVQNTQAIEKLTSWVPVQTLYKTIEIADIDIKSRTESLELKESTIKENNSSIPSEKFSLAGRHDLETFINEHIVDVLRKPEEYERMGIGFPGATILYGPPGSGKTFAIEKLAEYLGWPRYDINSESIGSPFIHETGKKIAQVFDEAIKNAPSVIIIDEMESYLSAREGKEQHHVEEVAEFLRKIPEAIENHVLVFAMTNILDSVDPAIRRRGRFDYIIEVGMASKEEIHNLLEIKMNDLPIDEDVNIASIAENLNGHPLSDVTFVLREAGRNAVKENLDKINSSCFEKALSMISSQKIKKTKAIGFTAG